MDIPNFNEHGVLPEGIYEANMDEIREYFCCFGNINVRNNLFQACNNYLKCLLKHKTEFEFYIDGSFVTDKSEPGDLDILLFVDVEYKNQDWLTLINDYYVRTNFKGLQLLPAFKDSESGDMTLDFAMDVEDKPYIRKGLVRVKI